MYTQVLRIKSEFACSRQSKSLLQLSSPIWSEWCSHICSKQLGSLISSGAHKKHVKTDFGLESSLKTLWRVLVPFTPLSSAVSHRRRKEMRLATRATRELEVCSELEVEIKRSKSCFRIRSLLLFTISTADSGFDRQHARTSAPRADSSMRHCWMMDESYTSSMARELKTLVLMESLLEESSLARNDSFQSSMRVETVGQWSPMRTALLE